MLDANRCLGCGSKYLSAINPATGFPFHYCTRCRPQQEKSREVVRDIRREQTEADRRRQLELWK